MDLHWGTSRTVFDSPPRRLVFFKSCAGGVMRAEGDLADGLVFVVGVIRDAGPFQAGYTRVESSRRWK